MQKVVVVTGSNGFIGGRLTAVLAEKGYKIRTINRKPHDIAENSYALDLSIDECKHNLLAGVNTVFHVAGKAHALGATQQDDNEYFQVNTEGTRKLLEASKRAGVERFIYFSSVKAVGNSDLQPMDEGISASAATPYGRSKFAAEQLVLNGDYVRHPVVIRPSMVYGKTDKGNLPRMIKAVKKGIFPPLPENFNQRSMVHVDDVVQAAILVAENPVAAGQIYIVSDGQPYSTRQIYDWIREVLGKRPIKTSVPMFLLRGLAGVGDVIGRASGRRFLFDSDALQKLTASAWYSSDKIVSELGFCPKYSLKESLPDIIHYLDNL